MRSLSSARLTSWNQRVSERTSSSAWRHVEPGHQLGELVGRGVVATAGAPGQLDRPVVQVEHLAVAARPDRVAQ